MLKKETVNRYIYEVLEINLNVFFSVLNEFILKNPTLESKKDQRELQVTFHSLSTIASIKSTMFFLIMFTWFDLVSAVSLQF